MANETDASLHYRLLKVIEKRPEISQRELAAELGLSLGKVNYCLQAFIARGLVKVDNFRRSDNKLAYAYLLTPKGIEEKTRVTIRFFRNVEAEYEALKREVEKIGRQEHASPTPLFVPSEVVSQIRLVLPDVIAVYVFDAAASGRTGEDGDINLALLADSPIDAEKTERLARELATRAGRDIRLIDLRGASAAVRTHIVREGKRLYCRDGLAGAGFDDPCTAINTGRAA